MTNQDSFLRFQDPPDPYDDYGDEDEEEDDQDDEGDEDDEDDDGETWYVLHTKLNVLLDFALGTSYTGPDFLSSATRFAFSGISVSVLTLGPARGTGRCFLAGLIEPANSSGRRWVLFVFLGLTQVS